MMATINTRGFFLLFAILTMSYFKRMVVLAMPADSEMPEMHKRRMDPTMPSNGLDSILKAFDLTNLGISESDCGGEDDAAVSVIDEDEDAEIIEAASCDYEASSCAGVAGLVFNPDNGQCVFPDQVGCTLYDLGFSTTACQDGSATEGDRIPISSEDSTGGGVDPERYFYVCVKETYAKTDVDGKVTHCPTGYLGARLLGCPQGQKFDPETTECA